MCPPHWFYRQALRARRNASGVTAIEFALLAPIFLLLLFMVIETGIIFFTQAMLQNAVDDAARLIRTGQAQSQNLSQGQFRDAVCNGVKLIMACNERLQIDVQAYSDFSKANYTAPLQPDGTLAQGQNNYQPGTSGEVVLVRATYTWVVLTPLFTPFLSNMANNQRLLVGTTAFRNEGS
jgi:Flp pilus assembly protein TadG